MKKLIISISILAVLFSSCKKCGTCTQTIKTETGNSSPQSSTSTFDACDDKLTESDGAKSSSITNVGKDIITTSSKTTCVIKNN